MSDEVVKYRVWPRVAVWVAALVVLALPPLYSSFGDVEAPPWIQVGLISFYFIYASPLLVFMSRYEWRVVRYSDDSVDILEQMFWESVAWGSERKIAVHLSDLPLSVVRGVVVAANGGRLPLSRMSRGAAEALARRVEDVLAQVSQMPATEPASDLPCGIVGGAGVH